MAPAASTSTALHPIDPAIDSSAEEKPRKKGSGRPKGSKDKPRAPGAPRRGRPPNAVKAAMALAAGSHPSTSTSSTTRAPKSTKAKKASKAKNDKKSILALFEEWRQLQTPPVPKAVLPHLENFLTYVDQTEGGQAMTTLRNVIDPNM